MHPTLENAHFRFTLDLGNATWNLFGPEREGMAIIAARTEVTYWCGMARYRSLGDWRAAQLTEMEISESPHGQLLQRRLLLDSDPRGLQFSLTFALSQEYPLFLWRLSVENGGSQAVALDNLDLLRLTPPSGALRLGTSEPELAFFSNGWQSWSYSGAYGSGDKYIHTRLGPLKRQVDHNASTPLPRGRGHFASDMFGLVGDRRGRRALLAGFLSQKQHFGSLEARLGASQVTLRLWASGDRALLLPGESIATDWACLTWVDVDQDDPLGEYLEAVVREHGLNPSPSASRPFTIPTGWCSWYYYSTEEYTSLLTAPDVRANLAAMVALRPQLPLQVCQIDDGYEAQVGDWLSFSPSFPEGVQPLAVEIKAAGFTPGLWLAPLIVHPRSRLAQEHPDWLLRGRFNRPVNAGYLWGAFATALDLTHPQALDYACQVVHTAAHEWGYTYLKLDFLYAAALPGRYRDPRRTRAQVLRNGLEALRLAAGQETFLLGCGCPLGSAIGLVDAMRISADTARRWYASWKGIEFFFKEEPTLPAARNALQNVLTRAPLHQRWWSNDPDCLQVRPETWLSQAEIETIATVIALSGGSLLLSDNLSQLPPQRMRMAQVLLPLIGRRPQVLDWFDRATPRRLRLDLENVTGQWHLLALINWDDAPQDLALSLDDFHLPPSAALANLYQTCFVSRFWQVQDEALVRHPFAAGPLTFKDVPPHGVALVALRPMLPGQPQYLGSDLHLSQGLEVTAWQPLPQGLDLTLERPGHAQGRIYLSLPQPPRQVWLNDRPVPWSTCHQGFYILEVDFEGVGRIRVDFE